jgi:AraC-like DNA-binding protein
MENTFYNMELRQFKELFTNERQVALGDDFCIVDVRYDDKLLRLQNPVRLDAYLVVFCITGRVRLSVNMKEFTMEEDQIALMIPGYIGQVVDVDEAMKEEIHYVMVGVSRRFLSTLHLDLNRIFAEGTTLLENPCVRLTDEEKEIAQRYLELGKVVLESEVPNKRECLGSLISSLFYLSEGVFTKRMDLARREAVLRSNRADDVFNKFLRLLAEFHTRERSVSFYADKLCLSPKYFSKLIKTASGRSAPDWIDTYVILEAKNYLKYSDMSIKQIVYQLHFADQPTFTKYFKTHTGLTPAQFRKG